MQRIELYGDLPIFLSRRHKGKRNIYLPDGRRSTKDVIESLGIPHTEIGGVYLDSKKIDISHVLEGGEVLEVYPFSYATNVDSREQLLKPPSFIADIHLGKLCRYLRLLGFDTLYSRKLSDEEIIILSLSHNRTILSRDIGLLKVSRVKQGCFVRNTDPRLQVKEVVQRYHLKEELKPYTRCLNCNGEIAEAIKRDIEENVPSAIQEKYKEFYICRDCRKVYWRGYHSRSLSGIIESITRS